MPRLKMVFRVKAGCEAGGEGMRLWSEDHAGCFLQAPSLAPPVVRAMLAQGFVLLVNKQGMQKVLAPATARITRPYMGHGAPFSTALLRATAAYSLDYVLRLTPGTRVYLGLISHISIDFMRETYTY